MKSPRVLVSGVVLSQVMGGVQRHNAELLPRVARILEDQGGALSILEGAGGIAFELPASVERIPSGVAGPHRPALRAAGETRAIARTLELARKRGAPFDLVHAAHFPAPRPACPLSLTLHDLRRLDRELTPLWRRLFARRLIGSAVRRAAVVFTVSSSVRARVLSEWSVPAEKVRVIPNAADHFEPLPRRAGPEQADAPLLHVGHLEPRKNIGLLLEALALDSGLPRLVLAGDSKWNERERLEARAKELGVDARVRFHGKFEEGELAELYATASCVVIPSALEGFGIPVLEAQRARVPLAVSSASALPETAGEGVPTFAPDDARACAAAIRAALAQTSATLDAHAQRAERFSWDASAELWVAGWRFASGTLDR